MNAHPFQKQWRNCNASWSSFEAPSRGGLVLVAVDPDDSTAEAIADWHYWVAQGYSF